MWCQFWGIIPQSRTQEIQLVEFCLGDVTIYLQSDRRYALLRFMNYPPASLKYFYADISSSQLNDKCAQFFFHGATITHVFFSWMENTISKADELKLMMSNTTHLFCPSKIHLSIYIYTHHNLAYLVGAFNPIEKQYDRQIGFHFPNRWGWKYQKCLSCHWFFDIVNCNGSNSNIPCFIPLLLAQKKLQYQKWGCTFPQLLLSWCFIGWTPPSPHLGWCRRSAWRRGALLAAIWRPTTASI